MTKTQTSDILQHLKDGRRLTQKEAINEYGAYRLSSIIYSLKKQGHEIVSIPTEVPTRYKKSDGSIKTATIVNYQLLWTKEGSVQVKSKTSFDSKLSNFINSIIQ